MTWDKNGRCHEVISIRNKEKGCAYRMDHSNTDTGTRVELHCHTKLGSIGAVNSAAEIIKAAIEEDMSAVAITDVGVAYAFPEAAEACKSLWSATAKECRATGIDPGAEQDFFKVIYGMETCLLRPTPESRDKGGYSIVLLVQNEIGKRNLYRLITASPQRAPLIVLITRQKKNCHKRQFLNGS